jgi:hypothetical protein
MPQLAKRADQLSLTLAMGGSGQFLGGQVPYRLYGIRLAPLGAILLAAAGCGSDLPATPGPAAVVDAAVAVADTLPGDAGHEAGLADSVDLDTAPSGDIKADEVLGTPDVANPADQKGEADSGANGTGADGLGPDAAAAKLAWSAPITLSAPGESLGSAVCAPTAAGGVRFVWHVLDAKGAGVLMERTIEGDSLGKPEIAAQVGIGLGNHLALAGSSKGHTSLAWTDEGKVLYEQLNKDGIWSAASVVSPLGQWPAFPSVAANDAGRWLCWTDFGVKAVWCRYGSWSGAGSDAAQVFADANYAGVVATPDGKFLLVATGAKTETLKIARLEQGKVTVLSESAAKGDYTFWRPAVLPGGEVGIARTTAAKLGEPEPAVWFATLTGTAVGAPEIVALPANGGGGLRLLPAPKGGWMVAAGGQTAQGPLPLFAVRTAAGWSKAGPVAPLAEAGGDGEGLAACRTGDGRVHVGYQGVVGGESALRYSASTLE